MEYLILATIIISGVLIWQIQRKNTVPTISFEQLMNEPEYKTHQRIDVRTKQEYQNGHLVKFKNIPIDELEAKRATLDQKKPIAVMCASGIRSAQAVKILQKHQYQVVNLKGGIQAAPKNFK
ncbi:MAG: rhodanese-like domain-containing protein [Culicoidibacterales bacterium]